MKKAIISILVISLILISGCGEKNLSNEELEIYNSCLEKCEGQNVQILCDEYKEDKNWYGLIYMESYCECFKHNDEDYCYEYSVGIKPKNW